MAPLTFDKPGLRGSSGDWRQQTFYDRVEQARAVITFLRRPSDIHPAHVGLFGVHQGAWICLLAAVTYADLPCIITVSGAGNASLEQDVPYVEHVMRITLSKGDELAPGYLDLLTQWLAQRFERVPRA
jgi:dienelactone hydrolase